MIKYVKTIDDINKYQTGELPTNAQKLVSPTTMEEMTVKAMPIAMALCAVMILSMAIKAFICRAMIVSVPAMVGGFLLGFALLIIHEWLHAIVYPKEAKVTIGKLKGKILFVALASFPLKRGRFILMSLLPYVLGIVPLILFALSSPQAIIFNGLMYGMAAMGIVSPYLDMYNVILVLKQAKATDKIMFYGEDMYRIYE